MFDGVRRMTDVTFSGGGYGRVQDSSCHCPRMRREISLIFLVIVPACKNL